MCRTRHDSCDLTSWACNNQPSHPMTFLFCSIKSVSNSCSLVCRHSCTSFVPHQADLGWFGPTEPAPTPACHPDGVAGYCPVRQTSAPELLYFQARFPRGLSRSSVPFHPTLVFVSVCRSFQSKDGSWPGVHQPTGRCSCTRWVATWLHYPFKTHRAQILRTRIAPSFAPKFLRFRRVPNQVTSILKPLSPGTACNGV